MHILQEVYTGFQDASFTEIYSPNAQAFRYLAHLTCALHSFRLADCHLTFPCTFLISSPLVYSWGLFQCIFCKSISFWINLSTSARVSSVRLTPLSCLLDLSLMPARGYCVSNTITLLVFSVSTVTWEAALEMADACWVRLVLASFSSAVSVVLNLQPCSFSLNLFWSFLCFCISSSLPL